MNIGYNKITGDVLSFFGESFLDANTPNLIELNLSDGKETINDKTLI